jgi:serine/threonine protein kinase
VTSAEPVVIELKPGATLEASHRYRVIRRLGQGHFGSVYQGEALGAHEPDAPPRDVAIKVLGSSERPETRVALKRELAALRRIEHPQTPSLYDYCIDGPMAFVVMEYFPSGSLKDALSSRGPLEARQCWRLLSDLLLALTAAHRASVLHLDVKPSNVLLDANGGYVLTDFGVAHASRMSKKLLIQGQIPLGLGTHGYRAPEQADQQAGAFDLRTDLWGVGATVWSAFTGVDLNQQGHAMRREENGCIFGLRSLADVHLACPPALESVVMDLLYLDPRRRPGGAAEVLRRVDAMLKGTRPHTPAASSRVNNVSPDAVRAVIEALVDPLWASICRTPGFDSQFMMFEDGDVVSDPADPSHQTHLLLSGEVRIEDGDRLVDIEKDEGAFIGAISTLTNAERRVTLRAQGRVWTCAFNEAEFEQFITCNPSVAVRMLRGMAQRIANGPRRNSD